VKGCWNGERQNNVIRKKIVLSRKRALCGETWKGVNKIGRVRVVVAWQTFLRFKYGKKRKVKEIIVKIGRTQNWRGSPRAQDIT